MNIIFFCWKIFLGIKCIKLKTCERRFEMYGKLGFSIPGFADPDRFFNTVIPGLEKVQSWDYSILNLYVYSTNLSSFLVKYLE